MPKRRQRATTQPGRAPFTPASLLSRLLSAAARQPASRGHLYSEEMAPEVGLKPTTLRLGNHCSILSYHADPHPLSTPLSEPN